MKWIFLVVIFLAGIYYIIYQRKAQERTEEIHAAIIQEDLKYEQLPEQVPKRYVLRLSPETRQILLSMTGDADSKIRWAAVELLYRIEDPHAPQVIKERLSQEPETLVRKNIIRMLGEKQDLQSLRLLAEGLKDYDKEVRLATVDTIGNFSNAEALPVLNEAMQDYDPDVKLKAIEALDRIQEKLRSQKEMALQKMRDAGILND